MKIKFQTQFFRQKYLETHYYLKRPLVCPNVDIPYFKNSLYYGFKPANFKKNNVADSNEFKKTYSLSPKLARDQKEDLRKKTKSLVRNNDGDFTKVLMRKDLLETPMFEMAKKINQGQEGVESPKSSSKKLPEKVRDNRKVSEKELLLLQDLVYNPEYDTKHTTSTGHTKETDSSKKPSGSI